VGRVVRRRLFRLPFPAALPVLPVRFPRAARSRPAVRAVQLHPSLRSFLADRWDLEVLLHLPGRVVPPDLEHLPRLSPRGVPASPAFQRDPEAQRHLGGRQGLVVLPGRRDQAARLRLSHPSDLAHPRDLADRSRPVCRRRLADREGLFHRQGRAPAQNSLSGRASSIVRREVLKGAFDRLLASRSRRGINWQFARDWSVPTILCRWLRAVRGLALGRSICLFSAMS
jgi:hypothetical protein